MQLAVEFPSVAYREGPDGVKKLAQAIENIGFDQLEMFDHVVMGYPTEQREAPRYPPQMPIMEAFTVLSFAAAVTSKIGLGTEVLVLPQRQPVLVAKQVSTIDTLSNGRMRLGVGVGWQASEYDALEENFANRGKRMDEAIHLIRAYLREESVDFTGEYYTATAMAMEPKPPQGADLPIWVGGGSAAALERTGRLADGWLGTAGLSGEQIDRALATIRAAAEANGRNPEALGLQMMLAPPPTDAEGKTFYADDDRVVRRATDLQQHGFHALSINATAIFQAGYKQLDAMIDQLQVLHDRLRRELD